MLSDDPYNVPVTLQENGSVTPDQEWLNGKMDELFDFFCYSRESLHYNLCSVFLNAFNEGFFVRGRQESLSETPRDEQSSSLRDQNV